MALFRQYTIRQKIITIILIVTIISLLIGFSSEIFSNILSSRRELINNTSLNAKLISGFSVPTLLFDDKEEAENILAELSNIPSVLQGVIFDAGNNVFAVYNKPGVEGSINPGNPDSALITSNKMILVTEPVISGRETIGQVSLIASADIIKEKTINHIKIIILIFLGSAFFAVLLSLLLERLISGPIIDLASITKEIHSSGNLSLRARKRSNDETGLLYDSFNDLITSLEARKAERDRAENALLEERENLERRILERTTELKIAKEKAEESDRLKSSFISNFSHEIRTPLNVIVGFTDLLTEEITTQEEKLFAVKCINESKDDMLQLIDNVLDTSSIETGQFYLNKSDFVINKELISLIKQTRELLIRRNKQSVHFNTSIGNTEGIKIFTDGRRIIQVLRQLLDNAIKYTDDGIIELGTFTTDSGEVGFFVKDKGCGIHESEREKIFTRFYKVETDKNRLYRGAGLGLALAKGIVTVLDGKLWVDSELKTGSTFYFTIPCETLPVEKEKKHILDISFLAGKKILIAEDVYTNYAYLSAVIKRNGMEAVNAKNGLEALYLANEHKFDLVLMDILMPEMDGIEAAKQIRKTNSDIPVIAQTAFSFSSNESDLNGVFNDILQKPIMPDDLIKVIIKYLSKTM